MRDYDTQLLESVAVRRRRLRDALMFGAMRARRTLDENLVKAFIGLTIAAVIGAGLVGWSYFQQVRAQQQRQEQQQQVGVGASEDRLIAPGGRDGVL